MAHIVSFEKKRRKTKTPIIAPTQATLNTITFYSAPRLAWQSFNALQMGKKNPTTNNIKKKNKKQQR